MTRLINMWSGPRNVSTAMMYSWRQRSDTTVWDEPMYGHYLVATGIDHPLREQILQAVPTGRDEIVDEMLNGECPTPLRFFKNMAHHLVGFDLAVVDHLENFLLTRDPRDMLPSLAKGLHRAPTLADTGFDMQSAIVDRLEATGRDAIVVDSRTLLDHPRSVLESLCEHLDVPFEEEMLEWPPGPKAEDGIWGSHWYRRLHATQGFEPYRPKNDPFPSHLEPLYETCAPLYDRLSRLAIRVA